MLELLRDPLWQFIGVVLAIGALAATFIVYFLQRQRKALSYDVLSKNQLLTVAEELEGKLQVLYEGQPARDICLLVIKLTNTGNIPIATADYERPVSFCTGASSKIISAVVTDRDPEILSADVTVHSDRVVVHPVLLNPKDAITLKLLVSDLSGISSDGRIIGVKTITNVGQSTGYLTWLLVGGLVLIAAGLALTIAYQPKPEVRPPSPVEVKVALGLFAAGYVLIFWFLFRSPVFRRVLRRLRNRG